MGFKLIKTELKTKLRLQMKDLVIQEITSWQLAKMLEEQDDIFLLDVRDENEINLCQLDNSVHISMNLIPLYLDRIPDDKQIVIYCHHGTRSLNVAHYLIENGFDEQQVYNLIGGIDSWALTIDKTMLRY